MINKHAHVDFKNCINVSFCIYSSKHMRQNHYLYKIAINDHCQKKKK